MNGTNEDLLLEIRKLKAELQQIREMVNALFNAVFEDIEEEADAVPNSQEDFNIYN